MKVGDEIVMSKTAPGLKPARCMDVACVRLRMDQLWTDTKYFELLCNKI